ncbi:hypothetical protein TTHERM_000090429 (macronuclear) [Tetrahymena thermophila SB210]|uniref:Uncharacterized protein n=1 Tax=Tetrahymena thermophila (strain SB210) TaxID=312017 RepID=W7XEP6_TETTS|nr:hypothetical protein TTHERM_000090429 [Tetrahymena thermophila SB210]EWS75203.1 hypothetical protein TTHERM_000090429 [Tetrahymena thermophila SB210]|eukprot:XP_012652194.1 hypothetical protein TTHERM_000090429 [Tetrahymena thermophila SB210]
MKIFIKLNKRGGGHSRVRSSFFFSLIKITMTAVPKSSTPSCDPPPKQNEDENQYENICKYRKDLSWNIQFDQYRDYINKFPSQIKKLSHVAKTRCINQYEGIKKVPVIEVVSNFLYEQNGINHQENQQIFNFISKSKHNLYKNILSAFKKHIIECKDTFLMSVYENLSENKWTFERIQQRVSTNLARCGRYNLKIKNLSKNRNLQKIFNHFLKNSEKLWLQDSKIKNKNQYIEQINLMILAQEKQILQNFTQCYKKYRKNSMQQ